MGHGVSYIAVYGVSFIRRVLYVVYDTSSMTRRGRDRGLSGSRGALFGALRAEPASPGSFAHSGCLRRRLAGGSEGTRQPPAAPTTALCALDGRVDQSCAWHSSVFFLQVERARALALGRPPSGRSSALKRVAQSIIQMRHESFRIAIVHSESPNAIRNLIGRPESP